MSTTIKSAITLARSIEHTLDSAISPTWEKRALIGYLEGSDVGCARSKVEIDLAREVGSEIARADLALTKGLPSLVTVGAHDDRREVAYREAHASLPRKQAGVSAECRRLERGTLDEHTKRLRHVPAVGNPRAWNYGDDQGEYSESEAIREARSDMRRGTSYEVVRDEQGIYLRTMAPEGSGMHALGTVRESVRTWTPETHDARLARREALDTLAADLAHAACAASAARVASGEASYSGRLATRRSKRGGNGEARKAKRAALFGK